MSDNSGILGEIIEQGASVVKQTVRQTAKLPSDLAKTAGSQVTGSDAQKSKAETREFVKSIYGADEKTARLDSARLATTETQKGMEAQKLAKLRQELHSKYYQRTFNPPKQEEERPAEAIERKKMEDLREKEKKKTPVLVQRARERVEKFPGASG